MSITTISLTRFLLNQLLKKTSLNLKKKKALSRLHLHPPSTTETRTLSGVASTPFFKSLWLTLHSQIRQCAATMNRCEPPQEL
ncbi:hypothetical protein Bca4012_018030 [Brassica carinata]